MSLGSEPANPVLALSFWWTVGLFYQYDADGDGTITPAELRKVLRAAKPDAPDNVIERAAAHAMHKGDTNRDGSLDFDEFANVPTARP